MKKQLIFYVILIFAMVIPSYLMAQGIAEDPNDVLVPIDGGLSLLVAAAVSYGSKKIYDARKK